MSDDRELKSYPPGFPWLHQFRRRSWWYSPAKGRTFVITALFCHDDGSIRIIELLESGKEVCKYVELQQMIDWLHSGQMQPVSTMPDTVH